MAKKGPQKVHAKKVKQSRIEANEIKALEELIAEGAPPAGSNPLAIEASTSWAGARTFDNLPLSQHTKAGIKAIPAWRELTLIQRAALPHALCGRDVLGAAKTGSGKTLAFLIPVRFYTTLSLELSSAQACLV